MAYDKTLYQTDDADFCWFDVVECRLNKIGLNIELPVCGASIRLRGTWRVHDVKTTLLLE